MWGLKPIPPPPKPSRFIARGGHWTVWDCGTYYEIEESGLRIAGGSSTLAVLYTEAANAGATIEVRIAN